MKYIVSVIFLIAFMVLAAAFPVHGHYPLEIVQTPLFILMCALFCVLIIIFIFRKRNVFRQIAYITSHVGLVLILVGALMSSLLSVKTESSLPVDPAQKFSYFPYGEEFIHTSFTLSVNNFEAAYYKPASYYLYAKQEKSGEFVPVLELETANPSFHFTDKVKASDGSGYLKKVYLDEKSYLKASNSAPSKFEAELKLVDKKGKTWTKELRINKPARMDGWKIYLQSYDPETEKKITLMLKKDPGEYVITAGLWLTLIGFFLICKRGKNA